MSNYSGTSRTNYFSVSNDKVNDFLAWAKKYNLKIQGNPASELVALFPSDLSDTGEFPDLDVDTEENFDFAEDLSKFLNSGSVAIVFHVGHQNLRYVHGYAVAVDHEGNRVDVSLNDIYDLAKKRWPNIQATKAEY